MYRNIILFDLDETLYSSSCGLWQTIRDRIDAYILLKLHLPESVIPALRQDLYKKYGTTLRGLQRKFRIDPKEYLEFVHNVPLHDFIAPNNSMIDIFSSLPQKKYIFTNADRTHAQKILSVLKINQFFSGIIDIWDSDPFCKPQPQSFQKAIKKLATSYDKCILVDDSVLNLKTAQELGIQAILMNNSDIFNDTFPQIHEISELPDLLASLSE